jgi:hypothetical protein
MPGHAEPDLLEEVLGLGPIAREMKNKSEDIVLVPTVNLIELGNRSRFGLLDNALPVKRHFGFRRGSFQ